MPNLSEFFDSQYFSGKDVQGKTTEVTIASAGPEPVGPDRELKPVVAFSDHKKKLPLNRTNFTILSDELGPDSDNWKGKKILLGPGETSYNGRPTIGVRIKFPSRDSSRVPASAVKHDDVNW